MGKSDATTTTTTTTPQKSPVQVVTFGGPCTLRDKLLEHFGYSLGLPTLEQNDLELLDDAISMLSPPEAMVRVVEVDTYLESESSIVKGEVPIGKGSYSLRQMTIILKRLSGVPDGEETVPSAQPPASDATPECQADSKAKEHNSSSSSSAAAAEPGQAPAEVKAAEAAEVAAAAAAAAASTGSDEAGAAEEEKERRDLPEIFLFWGRNMRTGGNLVVCPNDSMDRLIQGYLVCEVVQNSVKKTMASSFREGIMAGREGALMGVELGEASLAEQDVLENLLGDYSFHDASIGIVSLAASMYYFGPEGRNDVNVLTLLAVAVVAGLKQEATWPWTFKHIMRCSRIKDPIVRVSQCRQVHHHQGQLSGQGFLAIGLAVFGVYLEVFPKEDGNTPTLFRILLNTFQGGMIAVLVLNMVQAVEPMTVAEIKPVDRLRSWAREYLNDNVFDTVWYLTLLVALVWAGIIAVVITHLSFDSADSIGWSSTITALVVLVLSLATVNPGKALLFVWGLAWLIPVGVAFVLRSAFDTTKMLINRVSLAARRMAREVATHMRSSTRGRLGVRDVLILLLQVLPLTPLLLVFVPIPVLYFLVWLLHVFLRMFLLLSDAIIFPLSTLRLYPLLSDYGSVTWKMARLTIDVEKTSMRTLLKRRVSKLMEVGSLRERIDNSVLPGKPYAHLCQTSTPRLGCVAIGPVKDGGERVLLAGPDSILRRRRTTGSDEGSSSAGSSGSGRKPVPAGAGDAPPVASPVVPAKRGGSDDPGAFC